jgi:hypothetical protein
VLYLVSEDGPNRTILCAGAGSYAVAKIVETEGTWLPPEEQTPEGIAATGTRSRPTEGERALQAGFEQTGKMLTLAANGLGISFD